MAQRNLNRLSDDELYAEWKSWITTEIYGELINLGWKQGVFDLLSEITTANDRLRQTGSHILNWMFINYVGSVGMHLRREVDDWAPGPNLRKLLGEMEARPTIMNRGRYRALWDDDKDTWNFRADQAFERHVVVQHESDRTRDYISKDQFRGDRLKLEAETAIVKKYVEMTIAHRAPAMNQEPPTLKQFHDAAEAIVEVFKKYYALLTASILATHRPIAQYNTHECFTFPWWSPPWNAWMDLGRNLHHVTLIVKDLKEATAFYKHVFTMEVECETDGRVDLVRWPADGSVRIRLVEKTDWTAAPDQPVLAFEIGNLESFNQCFSNQATFIKSGLDWWGIRDPSNNIIELRLPAGA